MRSPRAATRAQTARGFGAPIPPTEEDDAFAPEDDADDDEAGVVSSLVTRTRSDVSRRLGRLGLLVASARGYFVVHDETR